MLRTAFRREGELDKRAQMGHETGSLDISIMDLKVGHYNRLCGNHNADKLHGQRQRGEIMHGDCMRTTNAGDERDWK